MQQVLQRAQAISAAEWAKEAHKFQKRKYTGEDYFMHPLRVARILSQNGISDDDTIVAAFLHDVVEDVYPKNSDFGLDSILMKFGVRVATMVNDVTNVYTSSAFPKYNRSERNRQESARLALISFEAKLIKIADMLDNLPDIKQNDPQFAKIYFEEKREVAQALMVGISFSTHSGRAYFNNFRSMFQQVQDILND